MIVGAVHKVRHVIFLANFDPPFPVTFCHTSLDPPESTSHISDPPTIFSRPSTKKPLVRILPQLFEGVLSGGFVRGSFVWKILSGMVFVRSPLCQNTSVTAES